MNVFEKFHAEQESGILGSDSVITIRSPNTAEQSSDDVILFISNGLGHDILAVTADGQMHFAPGYTPTQQAEAFRQAMNMLGQRAVFLLAPPPALDEIATTQSPDGTYYVDTPSPMAELHDIVTIHFNEHESKFTDPIREDVPHPDKLL